MENSPVENETNTSTAENFGSDSNTIDELSIDVMECECVSVKT